MVSDINGPPCSYISYSHGSVEIVILYAMANLILARALNISKYKPLRFYVRFLSSPLSDTVRSTTS